MHRPTREAFPAHRNTLVAAIFLTLSACTAGTTTPTTSPATAPAPPKDIHFDSTPATIKGKPFTLEIADSDAKREHGLMFRNTIPADHGMIFVFEAPDNYRFWMKNTFIPLDIIFLDATGKVLVIQPRQAHDETSMGPDDPATYVIELNLGAVQNIGLSRGDHIDIPEKILKQHPHSDEK